MFLIYFFLQILIFFKKFQVEEEFLKSICVDEYFKNNCKKILKYNYNLQ